MNMGKHMTVSATEANRSFSKLLRAAQEGTHVTITSRGKPVVAIMGIDDEAEWVKRQEALAKMREHWAHVTPIVVGPWTRDDLYERD